jgi:GNAT superfamily N-acetyltransferase
VVVRRIVGRHENRPLFSDALGELVDLSETELTIATAGGTLRVPLSDVHRAKRVPAARRPRAADVAALELAANDAWPAPVTARLGAWWLRSADGWTGRANSALAVGDPDRPLEAAIDAVEQWYADRGHPPTVNAPMPLAAPVNALLDTRGWAARPPVLVQTAPVAALAAAQDATGLPPVALLEAPTDDWLTMVAAHKGDLPAAAVGILTGPPVARFAEVRDGGDLLAVGRATITGDGGWLGLALVQTAPGARRRGLGAHLCRALARWGREQGAERAFLQVEEGNAAAVRLYRRLGFTTHHTYLTRVAPQSPL